MGMTRRERIKLNRERERAAAIGAEGVKLIHPKNMHCDRCGSPEATMYRMDGELICFNDLPFEWKYGLKSRKLISRVVSGREAVTKARALLAKSNGIVTSFATKNKEVIKKQDAGLATRHLQKLARD